MRNRRTKKMLREYPQLLDNSVVLTPVEVEKIIASADYILSFEELIERAKKRFPQLGLECWKEIDLSIQCWKQKNERKEERAYHRINYRVATAAIIILLGMFFAFVPAGQTLARQMYGYIVKTFDNIISFTPQESEEQNKIGSFPQATVSPDLFYSSVEEFKEQTGYVPFKIDAEWLALESIEASYDPDFGLYYTAIYYDCNGNEVCVMQDWYIGQYYDIITETPEIKPITIRDGYVMYFAISPDDGFFSGTAALEDSILRVGAEAGIDRGLLLKMLQ